MKSDIQALERALEAGPTSGPWSIHEDLTHKKLIRGDGTRLVLAYCDEKDAPYIAACDPNRIRRLLDERAKMLELLNEAADLAGQSPIQDKIIALLGRAES